MKKFSDHTIGWLTALLLSILLHTLSAIKLSAINVPMTLNSATFKLNITWMKRLPAPKDQKTSTPLLEAQHIAEQLLRDTLT